MMNLTWRHFQALVARCLYKFLLDGTLKAFGVIMEETVDSFQSKHYLIGCAFSLQTGIGYLIAPLAGLFDRRVHPRIVASIGGFLAGLGFIGRAFLTSRELWQLFLCLSISGLGFGLVNVVTVISLKEAFESSYPTAYSVTLMPSYIGIAVMPPLLEYLQREYGEHIGMCVFGVISWTLVISGLMTQSGRTKTKDEISLANQKRLQTDRQQKGYNSTQVIQKCSQDAKYEKSVKKSSDSGFEDSSTRSQSFQRSASTTQGDRYRKDSRKMEKYEKSYAWAGLKVWTSISRNHPEFLCLLFISILMDHGFISWSIFLVPYGEYLGLDSKTAVWLSTLGGMGGLVGRLYCIVLFWLNRMNLFIGLLLPVLCVSSVYVISLFNSSFPVLAVVSSFSGFGLSVQSCATSGWLPSCVCEYNFKTAVYCFYVLGGILTVTGGMVTGGIIDISGSYRVAVASLAFLSFVQASAILVWLLCPSLPSPEEAAATRKENINCCSGNQ